MARSRHVAVSIDLGRVRANVQEIVRTTGVPLIAVIKADAYGLGASEVAPAIRDLVGTFCVFSLREAAEAQLWERTARPAIAIGPPWTMNPDEYRTLHVRPAVSAVEPAAALRAADPLLCVDTGQQRFACPIDRIDEAIRAGGCNEAFTHATRVEQVRQLKSAAGGKVERLHAAGSSLLDCQEAWLDAVRPGLAMYHGAVRMSARLVEVHRTQGPAGYTGFSSEFHGVILAGYSNGLRAGPCLLNGRPSRILEVGMQSAFVEIGASHRPGDEVVLLGDTLSEQDVATAWGTTPHEAMFRLAGLGVRTYRY